MTSYTATTLLASARRRGLIPEAAATGTLAAADLVDLMSEELQSTVVPMILSLREEFLVVNLDFNTVAGQNTYDIPDRAIADKIRQVQLKDTNGSAGAANTFIPLLRVEPERLVQSYDISGKPQAYYFERNSIVLLPTPGTALPMRIRYFLRPGNLVEDTAVGKITAINTGTKTVTLDSVPTTFTSSVLYDLIEAKPNFETRGMDLSATVAGSNLTFAATLPTTLAVGDYVCLAGESPIPQIPVELHPLLARRTVMVALEGMGDPRLGAAKTMYEDAEKKAIQLLSQRDEGAARYIINFHGPGWKRWRR